ncbi:hypothetical protein TNCV_322251 [Trichonephila clavipes]|nr:hypothetical protein TNCV_322251 [Trichonephila clavipes]
MEEHALRQEVRTRLVTGKSDMLYRLMDWAKASNYSICDPAFVCDSKSSVYPLQTLRVCPSDSESPRISF